MKPNSITNADSGSVSKGIANPHVVRSAFSVRNDAVSELYNMDCIEGMKHYPDKWFDLAICDPPYNIDNKKSLTGYSDGCRMNKLMRNMEQWDIRPPYEYWIELFRVSKNIILWGGNYFTKDLPESRCWIVWNKDKYSFKHSDFEMAWTSFDRVAKIVKIQHHGFLLKDKIIIHPTQKPVMLYEYLLQEFAEKGQRILDTHVGSGSSRIACYLNGFDFVGFEIDEKMCVKQEKRFKEHLSQQRMSF